jgi:6-phospho-beta-glucosidase
LALVDPAADRVSVVGGLARRMLARHGHPARVSWGDDLEAAVDGAEIVLIQLRVGGQAARRTDETFPLAECCLGQETTGAGGLAKALRTVPVVLDIAERVRRVSPRAWILDFTNPVGIVTRALLDAGHRAVGLCNVAITCQRWTAAALDVRPGEVELDHVGLNHLSWVRSLRVDGADRLPEILANDGLTFGLTGLDARHVRRIGALPSPYLRYYYDHDNVVAGLKAGSTRADEVEAIERELLAQYADPTVDTKPEVLDQRGGAFYSEAAVELMSALTGPAGGASRQVLNVRNRGTLPFLVDDAVIEVPCAVDGSGPRPLPAEPVDPLAAGLIGHVSGYESLAVDAALRGGRDRVIRTLLAHPLIGQAELAERLADKLIALNTRYLPWA